MHEAGLAQSILSALRDTGIPPTAGLRVILRGGHGGEASDAAVLAHIAAHSGDRPRVVEIVHEPVNLVCSGCCRAFEATSSEADCPACGAPPLPGCACSEVDVEILLPEGP